MSSNEEMNSKIQNYSTAMKKFVVGYNKSVLLHTITQRSLGIVGGKIFDVKDSLGDVVATFEEIQATSKNVANHTEDINQKMEQITEGNSSMDQELHARADEINRMREESTELNSVFQQLFQKSNNIKELTGAIQDVSDRTNVLSINASIEAARAGEAGRGFRIIAGEVKKLSEQTNDFAENIENHIDEFHATVENVADYIGRFTDLLQNFTDDINSIRKNFAENKADSDMVGHALKEIAAASSEEAEAIKMGLDSLEDTFNALKDAGVLVNSLQSTYNGLNKLLDQE